MDNAKQHWKILQKLGNDLENRVRSFMVVGRDGEGVIVVTEDGQGFWFGTIKFGTIKSITSTEPTPLNCPELVQMAHYPDSHILLLNKRGEIYSMGRNNWGQLGLGTVDEETHFSPQLISSPHKFISVRCGNGHSLALTKDGKVWAWGWNHYGQVGLPKSTESSLCQIPKLGPYRVIAIECGSRHSLALTDHGEVYAWGWNFWGQLGDGSKTSNDTPTRIPISTSVQSIAAGYRHTLLLTKKEEVYACGGNGSGQLGLPTDTEFSASLVKVAGLPSPISKISSHPATKFSIAMSSDDKRCLFVWGQLFNETSLSTPWELTPVYRTVESPLSSFSRNRSTPYSVPVPAKECSRCQTDLMTSQNNRLLDLFGKMFDNQDSSPDIRFQVGDHSILAHRSVLQISSGQFRRFFSSQSADLNPPSSQFGPNPSKHTTNPIEPEANSTLTTIPISDHSYPVFYAYIRFLYLGCIFEVAPEHLPDLFSLSVAYLESELQKFCLSRMRTTLSHATCCHYYQFTLRHSLPEISAFQQELVQFISNNFHEVIATTAYQSMDAELCKKLTISMANLSL